MEPRGIWSREGECSVESFVSQHVLRNSVWVSKANFQIPWVLRHDLDPETLFLLLAAHRERKSAYAPYSNFLVGVAAETSGGSVVVGHNSETAIFDVVHAEGCVFGNLRWQDMAHILRVALVAGSDDITPSEPKKVEEASSALNPVLPCGKCRAMLWEFSNGNQAMPIYMSDSQLARVWITTIGAIYPAPFGPEDLGIDPKDYMIKRGARLAMPRQ